MGYLPGKKADTVHLRGQEGLSRTDVQPRATMKLILGEPHTQGVAGTQPFQLPPLTYVFMDQGTLQLRETGGKTPKL